ncbi:hypothetical protein [Aliarcobacter butzleri]|uniref:hypothetical protein n=1 Tax=Aliarcobacter butzleri TaxID=28197 RepID=UPI00214CCAAE|nr:hypothetical protein [Aliarcobacter butzleri]MCP3650222.1 hypothetical protein [Arcobacter sp. DNRA7]MCR1816395.1 hypothetical protein [Aliarcobacter butzleri]
MGNLLNIMDSITKEAISIVPGGGLAYETIKIIVSETKHYYEEQNEIKLQHFFGDILSNENKHLLEKDFTEQDYHLLLKKLIQDDDTEKVRFYSNLLKGIIENNIEVDYRKHYILSLSELNSFDINIMRKIYIYDNFEIENIGNKIKQLKNITKSKNPLINSSIGNLVKLGFMTEIDNTLQPTEILNEFISLIYQDEELKPTSINLICLENAEVYLSNFVSEEEEIKNFFSPLEDSDNIKRQVEHYKNVVSKIETKLTNLGISYVSSSPNNFHNLQKKVQLHILCVDHGMNNMNMAYWNNDVLRKNNTVKILMSKTPNEQVVFPFNKSSKLLKNVEPYDSIKHIECMLSEDFSNENIDIVLDELEKFIQTFFKKHELV